MKKNIRKKHSRQHSEDSLEGVPKHPPKRACSGYIAFLKEIFPIVKEVNQRRTFKHINQIISHKWQALSTPEKTNYIKKGKENFRRRQERWRFYAESQDKRLNLN